MLEYLVVGHVTYDVKLNGALQLGGTATYSALAAHHLGLKAGVITSADPSYPLFKKIPSIAVRRRTARCTTTFRNTYAHGSRCQHIGAVAKTLTVEDVPKAWSNVPIVHLGPVAREIDVQLAQAFPHSLLGVTPQGWLRNWNSQGLVSYHEWENLERVLSISDIVVLSLEDLYGDKRRLTYYVHKTEHLVLTLGQNGAIVYRKGKVKRVPAFAVTEVDPTGAGDVFATAYLIRFFETQNVMEAARFANCAASFVVESVGTTGMPSREQIEWRLRHGRLRD